MSDTAADYRMHELRGIDWGEMGGSRTASGVRVNADTSMACSAYTACIRVISDSVSSLPLHLYERLPNGGKRKATEHPIYRLLHQQPNPWQTAQEFRDWMTGLYLHYGASYAEIRAGARGPVSELWPLHSSRMEVERLENGRLRYIYREPDGRVTTYRQEQIFALRFTTDDGVHPIPTYRLFANAIGLAQALEAHGATYFGNGARPGIVLESENPVPVEAAERLRESWERMHRGPDRAHRTAVLPAGVKAHELSQSNEAAQFLETRAWQLLEICRAFRCPPHMIQDLSRSTYSNIEVQGTEFVQYCLLPHLKRWESAISRDLIEDDETYFAEHNVTGLLRGDHASRSAYYVSAIQNGWMSINEVREMENLNPLGDEGDKHFIQLNMTTLDQAGQEPPAPPDTPSPDSLDEPMDGTAEDDAEDSTTAEDSQQRNCGIGKDGFESGNTCAKGGGGGGIGDSGGGGGGGGGLATGGGAVSSGGGGSQSPQTPRQKQRRERLRDRIEGTQKEADREVKKSEKKLADLKKKHAAIKAELDSIKGAAAAAKKAYVDGMAKARATAEAKIAAANAKYEKKKAEIAAKYGKKS